MMMYQKIVVIALLTLRGLYVTAQNVFVEISPTRVLGKGRVVVNIDSLNSTEKDRLILFPLPIKLTSNVLPTFHASRDFNGIWYVDSAETKLWIGKVLRAKETNWKMEMDLENLMTEETPNSYTLTICSNYADSKGLNFFLPDRGNTEIVYANTLVFKGEENHKDIKCEPANAWKNGSNTKIKIYTFNPQNEKYSHLTFEISKADIIIYDIVGIILSFVTLLYSGNQMRKRKRMSSKIFWGITAVFSALIYILFRFFYLRNIFFDYKNVLYLLAPLIGFIIGYFGDKIIKKSDE